MTRVSAKLLSQLYFISKFVIIAVIIFTSAGCEKKVKTRPPGYFRLGPVKDFLVPETYLNNEKLLLRYDKGGLYVMSTECTHDLTYLKRAKSGDADIWVSEYSDSKYDANGKVIHGPSQGDLPYYELKIDSGVYGGPKDTLYAYIGKEKPPEWRLPLTSN